MDFRRTARGRFVFHDPRPASRARAARTTAPTRPGGLRPAFASPINRARLGRLALDHHHAIGERFQPPRAHMPLSRAKLGGFHQRARGHSLQFASDRHSVSLRASRGSGERAGEWTTASLKGCGRSTPPRQRIEIHDPAKKRLLDALFEGSGRRRLPYGGVPTFLDFPCKEGFADLDIALIGVPMDWGSPIGRVRALDRAHCAPSNASGLITTR